MAKFVSEYLKDYLFVILYQNNILVNMNYKQLLDRNWKESKNIVIIKTKDMINFNWFASEGITSYH